MAKEMMIVFVYDTLRCHSESEDPAEAVLYFHPGWVSDAQRHALCGQIVGTAHCVASLLSQPAAITLQSGKFLIREYGRYILAIGSDRNIPDWVLKNRAQLLTSMIKVYHGDLATIAAQFPGENNPRFAEKLYQMLETYLPVLQFGCHIFQRVPMLSLPKSATSIYMESMQILEYCQQIKGILGGVILYNNKIVASQLSPKLTSHLTVVDPYRIKSPAEVCQTDAPLPLGAQLLVVYVTKKDYAMLKKNANSMQEFSAEPNELINKFKKNGETEPKPAPPSGMKRDKSLLFTAVPEEDISLISPPNSSDDSNRHPRIDEENKQKNNMPDVVPFTNKPRPRPNKLSLSLKTTASIDECITEKCEPDHIFTGQTSVCSTPMVEYKRLHVNVLSICQNPETQLPTETTADYSLNPEPDVLKTTEKSVSKQKTEINSNMDKTQLNNGTEHFITKPVTERKLGSVSDIQESFKRLSDRASAKFRSRKSKVQTQSNTASPAKEKLNRPNMFRTITDPTYPVFRNDGVPISKALFTQYLEEYYADMNGEDMSKMENMFKFVDSKENLQDENRIEGFDSEMSWSPKHVVEKKVQDVESVKPAPTPNAKPDISRRKSLSLPLKSLNDDSSQQTESDAVFDAQSSRRRLSGVQLTPLMEKLSHLAFSDKSSGYGSRVMTPLEVREFATPNLERRTSFSECLRRQKSSSESDSDSEDDLDLLPEYTKHSVKAALFICGLQNMALMVVMDVAAANDPDAINALWETSLNTLGPIEQKCMEPLPTNNDSTEYSYLTLDPDWGTIKKGGPWASLDIATMGLIHNELGEDKALSEIILRTEESVVLGASCGGSEIYYQESGVKQAGVPMPSDIMATVQLKAKRRLHRDHSVVVL